MWRRKHNINEYLIPDARYVPESTRIPENIAYIPENKRIQLYTRKRYDYPVETIDLNWGGMKMRIVTRKREGCATTLDYVDALIKGDAEVIDTY